MCWEAKKDSKRISETRQIEMVIQAGKILDREKLKFVLRVANKYLRPTNRTVVITMPKEKAATSGATGH